MGRFLIATIFRHFLLMQYEMRAVVAGNRAGKGDAEIRSRRIFAVLA